MDLILNNNGVALIALVISVVALIIIGGSYASKVEKRLRSIELLAQKIEVLMTSVSERVGKIEDKILILTERVGWLEGHRHYEHSHEDR